MLLNWIREFGGATFLHDNLAVSADCVDTYL